MTEEKLEGVPIDIGGKEYIVSPISREEYVSIVPPCYERTDPVEFAITVVNVGVRVIHASLLHNYPDMTREEVREILHLGSAESMAEMIIKEEADFQDTGSCNLKKMQSVLAAIAEVQTITETIKNISNIK